MMLFDEAFQALFWSLVDKTGGKCWVWQGSLNQGYGQIHYQGRGWRAHRISVLLDDRELPVGRVVDHMCHNRSCVNPRHLRVVTPKVNTLENSNAVTAINKAKTYCKRGHLLDGANLTRSATKRGWRECWTCYSANRKKRRRIAK